MKRILVFLLVLLMLSGCGKAPLEPEVDLSNQHKPHYMNTIQREISNQNKLMGCAYLGEAEGDWEAVRRYLKDQGIEEAFPFLKEISEAQFVTNPGTELYLVVPRDQTVTLNIHRAKKDENGAFLPEELLLSFPGGKPVLLQGNGVGTEQTIVILASDESFGLSYLPCRNETDGRLANEGFLVADFTPYYLMEEFEGEDPRNSQEFSGVYRTTVTDTNERTVELELSFLPDRELNYSYRINGGTLHWFKGEWDFLSNGKFRVILWGGPVDEAGALIQGETAELDAYFAWEQTENTLNLYYENGIPLYPNAMVTAFPFTLVSE